MKVIKASPILRASNTAPQHQSESSAAHALPSCDGAPFPPRHGAPSVRLGFAGALPELDGDIASRKQPARALPLANSGHPSSDRKG